MTYFSLFQPSSINIILLIYNALFVFLPFNHGFDKGLTLQNTRIIAPIDQMHLQICDVRIIHIVTQLNVHVIEYIHIL